MKKLLLSLALGASLLLPPAADAQRRTAPSDQGLRQFLRGQLRDADRQTRYAVGWADLNGDRQLEALVYLTGSDFCGSGGCTLKILTPAGRSWRVVSSMTVTQPPVRLLPTRSRGWRDLSVRVAGGGIPGYDAQLRFDGRSYPGNPSVAPARRLTRPSTGRVLLVGSDRGRPLF